MAKVSQAAKVGIFVIVAGAGVIFIYRGINKEIGSGSGYTVHTYLDDAAGLANHSRVTIAGIGVGSIDKIVLENGHARINIRVNNDVVLWKNATAGKKAASLLGESVMVLQQGAHDPAKSEKDDRLKDGDEIGPLPPDPSLDDIKKNVNDITILVKAVAAQLAASVGTEQGGTNMRAILDNLAQATNTLNDTLKENKEFIGDTIRNIDLISRNGEPQVARILENIRVITDDVKVLVAENPANGANGKGGEIHDTITNINSASKKLESALTHIDNITGRVDRGEGTVGKLTKDEALVNEVQGVAEGVNDYVGGITRLQTIVGLRSDYNFLANTIKSYVEVRLQPREDKYYAIELVNDPRGKTDFTQTDVDTTNPNMPAHYRTITTTTTDAFRFSLQFAKRLGPFTGRFGIKESTGGLGVDLHLLSDRFELKTDLFGFGEELQPRLRIALGYEFIHRLWLLGGVDHLFLSERRDYFLGLQLRFTDEDLKTILPFAGGVAGGASGK